MSEISQIILLLGKAIDRAEVYGYPAEELQKAYEAAVKLKAKILS